MYVLRKIGAQWKSAGPSRRKTIKELDAAAMLVDAEQIKFVSKVTTTMIELRLLFHSNVDF